VPCSLEIRSTQLAPVHRVGNARHLKSRYPFVHLCPPYDNSSVHLTTTTEVRRSGRTTDGMRSSWRALRDSVLLSLTSAPTLPDWPCQEQRGYGSNATSAPVLDVVAPAYTNGVWPFLRLVSVAQRNRPLTRLSFTVQSINLLMERNALHGDIACKHND